MTDAARQTTLTAAYTPHPALKLVMDKLRQGTISGPLDRDLLLRIGVKESLAKRTLNSMRTLGLINEDGTPTTEFTTLINARPDQYQQALGDFLRLAYQHVFEVVDPATASGDELRNAFWGYEPRGQMDAMIRLFVALCEEAGIIQQRPKVEESRTRAPRASTPSEGRTRRTAAPKEPAAADHGKPEGRPSSGTADPLAEKRAQYADLLLTKIAASDSPAPDLLDRLERALGIAQEGAAP